MYRSAVNTSIDGVHAYLRNMDKQLNAQCAHSRWDDVLNKKMDQRKTSQKTRSAEFYAWVQKHTYPPDGKRWWVSRMLISTTLQGNHENPYTLRNMHATCKV